MTSRERAYHNRKRFRRGFLRKVIGQVIKVMGKPIDVESFFNELFPITPGIDVTTKQFFNHYETDINNPGTPIPGSQATITLTRANHSSATILDKLQMKEPGAN